MKQVGTDGVSPTHVSPLISERIELKEEVVLTVKVHQTIGIVGPMFAWREVYLRSIGLLIGGLSGGEG